jgi:nucleotide-binding universal stress UspA family protein
MDTQDKSHSITQPSAGYKKILLSVDYLANTAEIFEQGLTLAKTYGGQIMVFHCIPRHLAATPEVIAYAGMGAYSGVYSQEVVELEEQLIEEATEELHAWLASFVSRAAEAGVTAASDYRVGNPGKQISAIAKEWGADLIVLGRRGRKGLSELLLGSVSNYVIHHAPCSVLVVQH